VVGNDSKKAMKKVLENIQSGKFVKDWMNENKSGSNKQFHSMRAQSADHQIEEVGGELRNMMSWLGENKLVDKDKN
jgi:ketol-acid reductoisomerase